jgi:hypothetical protein
LYAVDGANAEDLPIRFSSRHSRAFTASRGSLHGCARATVFEEALASPSMVTPKHLDLIFHTRYMLPHASYAAALAHGGKVFTSSAEAPAYRPVLAGKARKSGEPASGAEVPKCRMAQILLCSTPIHPTERGLPWPKPRGFGRLRLPAGFGRKSTEIGGTGPWSRDAQMPGGANFPVFHPHSSGGALPPSTETPRIRAPALTGRF